VTAEDLIDATAQEMAQTFTASAIAPTAAPDVVFNTAALSKADDVDEPASASPHER